MAIDFSYAAIPHYFKKNGWLDPKPNGSHFKMAYFLLWCFSRCSSKARVVFHDHKEIQLMPFEFIFGRNTCSKETGLTEQEVRTIINQLNTGCFGEILKKSTNSVTNRFTCYMWSTEVFLENSNQQNNQPLTNRQPTDQPQARRQTLKHVKGAAIACAQETAVLLPISNEIEKEAEIFLEEAEKNKFKFEEKSAVLWIRKYGFRYVLDHLYDMISRKKLPLDIHRWFSTALKKNYVAEKQRIAENRQWMTNVLERHKIPWIKINQTDCKFSHKYFNESLKFDLINFKEIILGKMNSLKEQAA